MLTKTLSVDKHVIQRQPSIKQRINDCGFFCVCSFIHLLWLLKAATFQATTRTITVTYSTAVQMIPLRKQTVSQAASDKERERFRLSNLMDCTGCQSRMKMVFS